MIPKQSTIDYIFLQDTEVVAPPTLTYRMDVKNKRIQGNISGRNALIQRIYKELKTDKHKYPAYEEFGVKTSDLFGGSVSYAYATLTNRISECNFATSYEVESLTDFEMTNSTKTELRIKFNVNSIYGVLNIEEVYKIGDI